MSRYELFIHCDCSAKQNNVLSELKNISTANCLAGEEYTYNSHWAIEDAVRYFKSIKNDLGVDAALLTPVVVALGNSSMFDPVNERQAVNNLLTDFKEHEWDWLENIKVGSFEIMSGRIIYGINIDKKGEHYYASLKYTRPAYLQGADLRSGDQGASHAKRTI